MFIGREKELKQLEKQYNSNKFEFVVICGRKNVGKTTSLLRIRKVYFLLELKLMIN